ncbi:polyprenyl synthetase [Kitasatospora sp. NPDC089913]|uniref:polyprenyl synthetase n=1 Tax=Kitasatospora sp. NPDC089913 TaxID=3364080 RepID=UPI0037FB13E4
MASTPDSEGPDQRALLLVAGLADLAVSTAVSTIGSAVGTVQQLLRRSDGPELARDAQQDLMARGRIALDRVGSAPPAHLELLARQVVARQEAPPGDA